MILLSHMNEWTIELERVVNAYEAAVDEIEELIDQLEQDPGDEDDWLIRTRQERQKRQQLENALVTVEHLAQLAHAANAILNDAIESATLGLELLAPNEDVPHSRSSSPTSAQPQEFPHPTTTTTKSLSIVGAGEDVDVGRGPSWSPVPGPLWAEENMDVGRGPSWSPVPGPLWAGENMDAPLPDGSIILQGRYRTVQLLYTRPRLHLYLAQRLLPIEAQFTSPSDNKYSLPHQAQQPLVAIRELVLTGLSPQERKQIERAAFEEFVSPMLLGSPHLPGTGDRIHLENDRHYLIMQLRPVRGQRQAVAITLAELLTRPQWPSWLTLQTALEWGTQLCRIVARLHRLGVVLGDLNPAIVLVDAEGAAEWAPVLLVSWPPAPQFWPYRDDISARELCAQIFPLGPAWASPPRFDEAFAAPETLAGKCDERGDVYSLGAILYLLLTRYAPVAAALREQAEQENRTTSVKGKYNSSRNGSGPSHSTGTEGIALIPPRLFNYRIPIVLEHILLRALALNPVERYSSASDLVAALETVEPQDQLNTTPV